MISLRSPLTLSIVMVTGVIGSLLVVYQFFKEETPDWITTTVTTGDVVETVSVSGFVEAKRLAELAFPSNGTVTGVLVTEGDHVATGDVLATLGSSELVAERAAVASTLLGAKATYEKLLAGPRSEVIALADSTLKTAQEDLNRITKEETAKIANARASLLSTGLTAVAVDTDESTTPPSVSGTYTCAEEGRYTIEVYGSNSRSGFSYRYQGLESGTTDLSVDQPTKLGECGLYLLFSEDEAYQNSVWVIDIPNRRSATYTSLFNAYTLTSTQAKNAIARAENALRIAENDTALSVAPARSEDLREAAARIQEAEARLTAIDARLADRSIVAPFAGTVTDLSIVTGESAPATPVISLLADEAFLVKVRIPEIDIRKVVVGQKVTAVFDAADTETITGSIVFVSPVATQIDGVAYFEATIDLDTTPDWLRAGLNADVDIIITKKSAVTRLPKRFIVTDTEGNNFVLLPRGTTVATTTIDVIFLGNDGYAEIAGLPNETTVVAP